MTIDQLADESLEKLTALDSLDTEAAETLLATAQVTRDELHKMIEKMIGEELEKEAAEERPLFDEDALSDEIGVMDETDEPSEVEAPEGDLFTGLPDSDEESTDGESGDDDEEKKVDPFADTELDD
jgi:hypothetical protein